MAGFVRCLNMQEEEILVTQGGQTIFGFAEIIRVKKAGRSGHIDHLEPGEYAKTPHQINRGNDRTAQTKAFGDRRDGRTAALSPQPDRGDRLMPRSLTPGVDRMPDAYLLGAPHQRT